MNISVMSDSILNNNYEIEIESNKKIFIFFLYR